MTCRLPIALASTLLLASCGTTTSSTPPSTGAVYFHGIAGHPAQRPASLLLSVDGTLEVVGVQWSAWGGTTATGTGNAEYHSCTPNCAQAPRQNAVVSIRLSGIRLCAGLRYYSGVTLTLNSGRLLDEQFLQRSWSPC